MDFSDPQPWKTLIYEKIAEHASKSKDKRRTEKSRWHHSNMIKYFERLLIEYEQNETEDAKSHEETTSGNSRVYTSAQCEGYCGDCSEGTN